MHFQSALGLDNLLTLTTVVLIAPTPPSPVVYLFDELRLMVETFVAAARAERGDFSHQTDDIIFCFNRNIVEIDLL
jgi:hypothetical protein